METTQQEIKDFTDMLINEKRFPPLIRTAWFSLNQAFRQRLLQSENDITPNQFTVLRWLTEFSDGELSQKDLTQLMSSDANTIASLMRRMEEDGLVSRTSSMDDRRRNITKITEKGTAVFNKAKPIAIQLQKEVLETLNEDELQQFIGILNKIALGCRSVLKAGNEPL